MGTCEEEALPNMTLQNIHAKVYYPFEEISFIGGIGDVR